MVRHLIYGKIILDDLRLRDGRVERGLLGGGGPQALWGAGLWSDSLGFLSRCGSDLSPAHEAALRATGANLRGLARYADLPTLRGPMLDYDEAELMQDERGVPLPVIIEEEGWQKLLSRPLALPHTYRSPRLIHLLTEYATEPMVAHALALQEAGALLSLEPLIDYNGWQNADEQQHLIGRVDIVTPDWRAASAFAGSEEPAEVVRYWSQLGPGLVAIRHGAAGSYLWSRSEGVAWHVPPVPVEIVDPTGAGNAYGAGLAIGWCQHEDARQAGARAAVSASFLLEQPGPPAYPPVTARAVANARLQWLLERIEPL